MNNIHSTNENSLESAIRLAGLLRGHPKLHYLQGVVADLIDLEPRVADLNGLPHLREAIALAHQIESEVDWEKASKNLRHYPPIRRNSKGHQINPYNGDGLSDYFIWPTLLTAHEYEAINTPFRRFLAESIDHLIGYVNRFSTIDFYMDWCENKNNNHPLGLYRSTAFTVSVSLRYLVHYEHREDLIRFLTEYERLGFLTAINFARDCEFFSDDFRGRISAITRMIDYMNNREPPTRTGGGLRARRKNNTEMDGCKRVEFVIKADVYTDEEDSEIETYGSSLFIISPNEIENSPEIDSGSTIAERNRWIDPAYQVQHVARSNLALPYANNYLQPYQLAHIDTWIRNSTISISKRRLLAGMLLLGRSYRSLQDAKFALSSKPHDPDVEIELLLDIGCWRIRPELPDIKPGEGTDYLSTTTSMCLPILPEWKDFILPINPSEHVDKFITEGLNMPERGLLNMLTDIDRGLRPSMIMQWIGRTLFLTDHTHNAAALITPYGAPHLSTLGHYEHPRLVDITKSYCRTLQKLQSFLPAPPLAITIPTQDEDARTGTPTASNPTHLKHWISSTLEKLTTMSLDGSEDLCLYSNQFVRYSLFMISANCLLRGVTNPDIQLIDRRRRLVVISDKDRGGRGAMSRLVPLTPDGLAQLDHMNAHRLALRTLPGMPMIMDITKWPILIWNGDKEGARHSLQIMAATTKDIVSEDFPGRLNAFRKLLHTRIEEAGIPGQYLDSLCGHWHPGMEAYSQFSALNPRMMTETVLPVIIEVMRDLGFRPIRSRLV